ncbi:TadE/TadG family type IV pilus assembly protein [Actinacidiphila rubida]|uniref:Putative Flp pilus-assembly TadG-like N-terminal domain-containing protein n=1 Tax=Actinacidiphila rubida TaxID=310780 RepID=A0A1H8TDW8_9ACTN|nr:pilus assembly protein TadG-related protein [Actinacidiphila rubida]SEO89300.1 hypothetical protein SAMN05216267_10524 [Actinacidiphila rubida]
MIRQWKALKPRAADDRGGIAVYTAIVTVMLLGIIGLVVDGGGKLRETERADTVAMEAARAGGQALDPAAAITGTAYRVDPQAARAAAYAFLHQAGARGHVNISPDRTSITVTVTGSYATKFLPVVGIGSLPVTGHGSAKLLHGVQNPD